MLPGLLSGRVDSFLYFYFFQLRFSGFVSHIGSCAPRRTSCGPQRGYIKRWEVNYLEVAPGGNRVAMRYSFIGGGPGVGGCVVRIGV